MKSFAAKSKLFKKISKGGGGVNQCDDRQERELTAIAMMVVTMMRAAR